MAVWNYLKTFFYILTAYDRQTNYQLL
jgi:hypothetical protein